ncbi:MAG: hypothetical protein ACJ71I_04820 [Nitrososphaeraceae archaeon]
MNHTTLVILAVLVAAALVTGMFASGIQAAQAGGRHKNKGSGDSVAFEQENKQKAKCLALVISRADVCNQEAQNNFNVNVPGKVTPPAPIEEECTRALPTTVFDVTLTEASGADFPIGTVICLLKPGQNSPQASPPGAAIIPPSGSPLTGQTVRIDNSVGGDCPQGVTATVDSGNPPGTFDIGDTACITIST